MYLVRNVGTSFNRFESQTISSSLYSHVWYCHVPLVQAAIMHGALSAVSVSLSLSDA